MRKPKTPLMSFLQKCFRNALTIEEKGIDLAEELREKQNTERYNRRQFFTKSLGTAAATGLLLSFAKEINAQRTFPQIAIVGAGIAGLNAAYQLRKQGFRSNVKLYEGGLGNSWGRIQTKDFGNGITAELGGEFIDSDHLDMLRLAREFKLPLLDTLTDAKYLVKDTYFFRGRHYTENDVIGEFRNIAKKIERDNKIYESENAVKIEKLDNTSIEQYLKNLGASGWFYDLLNMAYTSEFGLGTGEQSALNFITMIGTSTAAGDFKIFGDSDERYKIKDGNAKLINSLIKVLETQIETDRKLESIRQNNNAKYTLSFSRGDDVIADAVILALPFINLRNVEFSQNLFTSAKLKTIRELGYGTSAKLLLETKSRVWREQKYSGYLFNEKVQNGWDYSQGQKQNVGKGGYTVFLGGSAGRSLDKGEDGRYINELNDAFPGFKDSQTNSFSINWSEGNLAPGGYACYKVGQWTSISGEEIKPQKNIFFCGEHCSSDFQGYMNGGAETGRDAALKIITKFTPQKKKKRSR